MHLMFFLMTRMSLGFWKEGHKRPSTTLMCSIYSAHAIPVDVNLVSRLRELHVSVSLPLCTFGKGHCMCFIFYMGVMFHFSESRELCKLFEILLRDVVLSSLLVIYSVIIYGYTGTYLSYTLTLIKYYFILFLDFFHLWLRRTSFIWLLFFFDMPPILWVWDFSVILVHFLSVCAWDMYMTHFLILT